MYALLDTQSETSHIRDKVCDRLGLNGAETHLQLSTLALDNETIECKRETGLQARGHKSQKRLRIPTAYTQDKIPENPDQIPARETALKWRHLQAAEKKPMSLNDKEFIDILNDGLHLRENTHYEMPLPFKDPYPMMPNNREIAMNRLMQLKRKLQHNEKFRLDYERIMAEIIDSGYAEEIPENDNPIAGHLFYILHHGVYHPKKPEKIRVVFDSSSNDVPMTSTLRS